jgi:adenine-specific DNA-methyltransferase
VAIQRTSSRGQKRRLAAALIPGAFVEQHGGVVAENHVILLVRTRPDAKDAQMLVDALNTPQASEQLDRVCGSASISVRLLEKLKLGTS